MITLGTIENTIAHYFIVSTDGKVAKKGSFDRSMGNSVQTIDVSNLARGMYILILTDGTNKEEAKLVLN